MNAIVHIIWNVLDWNTQRKNTHQSICKMSHLFVTCFANHARFLVENAENTHEESILNSGSTRFFYKNNFVKLRGLSFSKKQVQPKNYSRLDIFTKKKNMIRLVIFNKKEQVTPVNLLN